MPTEIESENRTKIKWVGSLCLVGMLFLAAGADTLQLVSHYRFTGGSLADSGPAGNPLQVLGLPNDGDDIEPEVIAGIFYPAGWGANFDGEAYNFNRPEASSNGNTLILGTGGGGLNIDPSQGVRYELSFQPNPWIGINSNPMLLRATGGGADDQIVLLPGLVGGVPASPSQIVFNMFNPGLGFTLSLTLVQDDSLGALRWGGGTGGGFPPQNNSGYHRIMAGYDPSINKLFIRAVARNRFDFVSMVTQEIFSADLGPNWASGLSPAQELRVGGEMTRGFRVVGGGIDEVQLYQGFGVSPSDPPDLTPISEIVDLQAMQPQGEFYQDTVPDTLDLAERAALAVNALTGAIKPGTSGVYHTMYFGQDPPIEPENLVQFYTDKYVRVLPKMRTMCGSNLNLPVERDMMVFWMGWISSFVGSPGTLPARPHGGTAMAIYNWYVRDNNPDWLDWGRAASRGLEAGANVSGDRAFWDETEPTTNHTSCDGSVHYIYSFYLRSVVRNFLYMGDQASIDLADMVVRSMMRPVMWDQPGNPVYNASNLPTNLSYVPSYPGEQHGTFSGHSHAEVLTLQSLLNYAIAAGDLSLQQVCKEGYEHLKQLSWVKLGHISMWFPQDSHGCSFPYNLVACEGGSVGDTVQLAVTLTDAGIGDYWDDIEYYVRNNLAALQVTDVGRLQQASGGTSPILDRYVGAFLGAARPTWTESVTWGDSAANGGLGMYYAWHAITRFDQGTASVNLLLNRASKWMDVYSHLPYEGKVVLRNKLASTARVRIPNWVGALNTVDTYVNDVLVSPGSDGRYLVISTLQPDDMIRIEFPISETVENFTWVGTTYTVTFRGSTLVDISPDHTAFSGLETWWDPYSETKVPLYQRDHLRTSPAPMKEVTRFVADRIIPLQAEVADDCLFLVGDFDGDCVVGLSDLMIMAGDWLGNGE